MERLKLEKHALLNDSNLIRLEENIKVDEPELYFYKGYDGFMGETPTMSQEDLITFNANSLLQGSVTIKSFLNTFAYCIPEQDYSWTFTPFNNDDYAAPECDGTIPFIRLKLGDSGLYLVYAIKNLTSNRYMKYTWAVTNVNDNSIDYTQNVVGKNTVIYPYDTIGSSAFAYFLPIIFNYNGKEYISVCGAQRDVFKGTIDDTYRSATFALSISEINEKLGQLTPYTQENLPTEQKPQDYTGLYDDTSDIIDVPPIPSISVADTGFINMYLCDKGELENFINEFYPNMDFYEPISGDALSDLISNIGTLTNNITSGIKSMRQSQLLQFILGIQVVPIKPTNVSNIEKIKVGYEESNISVPRVLNEYIDFDFGTLNIGEYYGSFLDYVGTVAKLYLPCGIGFVPIANEFFQNGKLQVKYRFNILNGTFNAFIISSSSKSNLKDTVIATYSGTCVVNLPLMNTDFSNTVNGLINGSGGLVTNALSGNVSGVLNSGLSVLNASPTLNTSNNYNATSSYMDIRVPYLVIERPIATMPKNYKTNIGFPSQQTVTISDCIGYCQFDISNFSCNNPIIDDADVQEIKDILNNMIFIRKV